MAVAIKRDFSISYGLQTDKTGSSTGNTLFVDQVNDRVAVGLNNPSEKFEVSGNIKLSDDNILKFGTNNDLQIYYDGTLDKTIIDDSSGELKIQSDGNISFTKGTSENLAVFEVDGAVKLYYDNNLKFETTSSGVDIDGQLKVSYLKTTTAFSDNITNVVNARLTGVLNSVLTLPNTAGKTYIIHSIYASNIARVEQQTAGASATIATTGFDTEKNIGAADALRTEGVYTIPSDVWTSGGSGTEAVFTVTVDGSGAATIAVDYAGIGFAVDDTITVPDANLGGGGAADLTFQVATLTGVVESVNLLVPGEGYVEPPTVYFDDGTTGTGSIITADVDSDGKLIRLNLINRGSGYVADDGNLLRIDAPPLTATEIGISGSFVDSSTSVESYFAFDVPIPVGGALDVLKQPQILNPNDIIKMQSYDADGSGLSDAADVFITYEEVDDTFYTGSVASLTTTANTTLLTAPSTNPLLVRSIRLTNTEFVGDYDVSIKVNDGSNTYYLVRNIIIPSFATVEICDTPRRIEANWSIEAELSVIGQDVNLASSIDIQVSAKKL